MARERREYYDINSTPTGKTYLKGDPVLKGLYPMVVMVCIQNSEGKFLMQKRVPEKGGDYSVTGGHPKAGETPLEGMITEIYEELGLKVLKQDLIVFDEGCDGTDCYKMYYLKKDIDITKLTLQKEELTEVKWFSIEELEDMVKNKILDPNQIACFKKCIKYLQNKKTL